MSLSTVIAEARFYAPLPDALGRAARNFISLAGETPPARDTAQRSFDRTQDPQRLANWANALGAYEDDPTLGAAVSQVYSVVDQVLVLN